MRFLYVSRRIDSPPSGGGNLARSHYKALINVACSNSNVVEGHIFSIVGGSTVSETTGTDSGKIVLTCKVSRMTKIINRFMRRYTAYSYDAHPEEAIIEAVQKGNYDFIWFDDGIYGSTIRRIKKLYPKLPVLAFYHIVPGEERTRNVIKGNLFKLRGALKILEHMNLMREQKLSAHYADVSIVLNERDNATFRKLYGFDAQLVLPVCCVDALNTTPATVKHGTFNIIFCGYAEHFPNIDGIKWFARNVMPSLDGRAKLFIVGSYMDRLKDEPEFRNNQRIEIIGMVDSLEPYYNMADLVIVPIFIGEGMMTKVAEALMYGKNILAKGHALNGYYCIQEQCRCDTAEEFITKINGIIESGTERFNPAMRKIYEEKYSVSAIVNMIRGCFRSIGIITGNDEKC